MQVKLSETRVNDQLDYIYTFLSLKQNRRELI